VKPEFRESPADLFPKPHGFFPVSFSQNEMRFQPINSVHPLEIVPCPQFQNFIVILRLKIPRDRRLLGEAPIRSCGPWDFFRIFIHKLRGGYAANTVLIDVVPMKTDIFTQFQHFFLLLGSESREPCFASGRLAQSRPEWFFSKRSVRASPESGFSDQIDRFAV
jgi:hypothetical protein